MATRKETTLMIRIGDVSEVVTTKNGRLVIEVFDHDARLPARRKEKN